MTDEIKLQKSLVRSTNALAIFTALLVMASIAMAITSWQAYKGSNKTTDALIQQADSLKEQTVVLNKQVAAMDKLADKIEKIAPDIIKHEKLSKAADEIFQKHVMGPKRKRTSATGR